MTNEERHQAIEWLKRRPVMMAGAKRMYDLAVEALEAYVPDKQPEMTDEQFKDYCRKRCLSVVTNEFMEDVRKMVPAAQPDEKLEKCRFEYINACRIVTYPTPDTTKKDISDAYAVIKALQPIFGDTPFAKVERGETDG